MTIMTSFCRACSLYFCPSNIICTLAPQITPMPSKSHVIVPPGLSSIRRCLRSIRARKKKENPSFSLPRAPSMFLNSRRLVRFAGQMNTYFWTASRFFRFLQFTARRHAFERGEAARTESVNPNYFLFKGLRRGEFHIFGGRESLYFPLLKLAKRQRSPLGQNVFI